MVGLSLRKFVLGLALLWFSISCSSHSEIDLSDGKKPEATKPLPKPNPEFPPLPTDPPDKRPTPPPPSAPKFYSLCTRATTRNIFLLHSKLSAFDFGLRLYQPDLFHIHAPTLHAVTGSKVIGFFEATPDAFRASQNYGVYKIIISRATGESAVEKVAPAFDFPNKHKGWDGLYFSWVRRNHAMTANGSLLAPIKTQQGWFYALYNPITDAILETTEIRADHFFNPRQGPDGSWLFEWSDTGQWPPTIHTSWLPTLHSTPQPLSRPSDASPPQFTTRGMVAWSTPTPEGSRLTISHPKLNREHTVTVPHQGSALPNVAIIENNSGLTVALPHMIYSQSTRLIERAQWSLFKINLSKGSASLTGQMEFPPHVVTALQKGADKDIKTDFPPPTPFKLRGSQLLTALPSGESSHLIFLYDLRQSSIQQLGQQFCHDISEVKRVRQ